MPHILQASRSGQLDQLQGHTDVGREVLVHLSVLMLQVGLEPVQQIIKHALGHSEGINLMFFVPSNTGSSGGVPLIIVAGGSILAVVGALGGHRAVIVQEVAVGEGIKGFFSHEARETMAEKSS